MNMAKKPITGDEIAAVKVAFERMGVASNRVVSAISIGVDGDGCPQLHICTHYDDPDDADAAVFAPQPYIVHDDEWCLDLPIDAAAMLRLFDATLSDAGYPTSGAVARSKH
jgi:hypothetical protein